MLDHRIVYQVNQPHKWTFDYSYSVDIKHTNNNKDVQDGLPKSMLDFFTFAGLNTNFNNNKIWI